MADAILSLRGVDVFYGQSRILRDIDLEVPRGSITAVMGRNGVGKTTLLKAIMGQLPAKKGTIRFGGQDVTARGPDQRARLGMGYVPQGREIFSKLTVLENLKIGYEAATSGKAFAPDELVYDLFPVLAQMEKRLGGNLSGGQQQQLAIGRALVGEPSLLLLDEPTEGIQPSIILEIEKVLIKLKERGNFTIVLVEQYFEFAREIADYFYMMDRGAVAEHGARGEISDESIKKHLTF